MAEQLTTIAHHLTDQAAVLRDRWSAARADLPGSARADLTGSAGSALG